MASHPPLILLPPSEGKAPGGDGPPWSPGTMTIDLDGSRERVLAALVAAMRGSEAARGKLLGVKGPALAAATRANREVRAAPTMPAIERYTGVLYDALDAGSLSVSARGRLHRSVLIVSGLWGLVAPSDPIPDHRLKMGATLGRLGRLSSWWRHELTGALAAAAAGRAVWDLLPSEHAAAWRPDPSLPRLTVTFLERRPNGSLAAVSHWNKSLKGALVRFLAEEPGASAADLVDWVHPSGYRLDPTRTERRDGLMRLKMVQAE